MIAPHKIRTLNLNLENLKQPREFARGPRTTADLLRYKATEFRQFLLYTGPVVLLNKLHV